MDYRTFREIFKWKFHGFYTTVFRCLEGLKAEYEYVWCHHRWIPMWFWNSISRGAIIRWDFQSTVRFLLNIGCKAANWGSDCGLGSRSLKFGSVVQRVHYISKFVEYWIVREIFKRIFTFSVAPSILSNNHNRDPQNSSQPVKNLT